MWRASIACILFTSACTEPIDTAEVSSELSVSAIPRGSTWRYWDRGDDLRTSWRGAFDDASWSRGAGPLGFGEPYLATTVGSGPITHYVRHTFWIDDPATVSAMVGEIMYDDGVVVYLNGLEIVTVHRVESGSPQVAVGIDTGIAA